MIKADNQSDKHLTVAGLTVLGDVQSANLQRFEKNLQETFDKTQNLTAQQKEFWKNLADDNLITPVEKKQIKQEIAIIEKTYQALHKKAQEVGQEFNPLFTSYATAYRELKDYIIELKLFDNMNENTRVNKTEFNLKFSDYYEFENVVQSVFLGTPTYTMRVLNGLNDEGTEGEVAIYRNIFYRRENGEWILITGDRYLGLYKTIPANGSLGDFFLAEEDFTGQIKYKARGKYLKANGKFLTSAKKFKKGFIYKLEPTGWKAIENKNDHRYVIATEDLIEIGETISLHLQKWFTDIDETLDKKIEHIPEYKGAVSVLPNNPNKGDYFTWAAESTNEYVKGKVYMWDGEAWKLLDPTDTTNNQQFMTALTDILKTNATGEGYFSTIFASALIASNAFIQNLQSQIITLTQALNADGTPKENTGIIQSKNYLETNGKEGWQIRADGGAEFKHITLDYIKSEFAALKNSKFSGELECGNLIVKPTLPVKTIKIFDTFENTTDNYLFAKTRLMYLELFDVPTDKNGYNHLTNITVTRMPQTLFGENTKAFVDNEEVKSFVLTNSHDFDVDDGMNRNSTIIKAIMGNNTQKIIYSYYYNYDFYGHDPTEYKETQLLKLEIQKEEISTLGLFILDLPTENPYETGRLWIDNDILKISKSLTDNE